MNLTEKKYLASNSISHIAKSLYVFYLRPLAEQNQCIIDLFSVTNYLFSSSSFFPTVPNLEISQRCLDELEYFGLLKRKNQNEPWQGNIFILPYYLQEDAVPALPFKMTLQWEPSANFHKSAILCGLEDSTYTPQDLSAFKNYWVNTEELRNQVGWERAFAQRLIKSRQVRVKPTKLRNTNALQDDQKVTSIKKSDEENLQIQNQLEKLFKD